MPDVQGEDDIHNIDPEFTDEVPEETLQASNHLGQRNNSKIDQFTYAPDNYLWGGKASGRQLAILSLSNKNSEKQLPELSSSYCVNKSILQIYL